MSQTATYSEISSGGLHQQELRVPLQAIWLYDVAYNFILFLCENGVKGRLNGNYNLKWYLWIESFVETNEVIRSRRSKTDYTITKRKRTNSGLHNTTQQTKNWGTWTLLKIFHISKILQPSQKWMLKIC